MKQFKSLFEMDGIELSFTDDALKEIVHETMSRKTGARGLRSVMERTLQKAMFTMPGSDVKKLVVTADTVKKGLAVASEEASPEDNSVEFGGVADLSESEFVKDSPRRVGSAKLLNSQIDFLLIILSVYMDELLIPLHDIWNETN